MSSEEELESFEVTDNDLKDAFYPGFRRKFTKEQAIYGMWANDEDRAGSGASKRTRKGGYTTPMDFVSGGYTQKQDDESDNSSNDGDKGELFCTLFCYFDLRHAIPIKFHHSIQNFLGSSSG